MEENNSLDAHLEQSILSIGIPPCPKILLDLIAESKKEEPDLHRLEVLISADVGLSAGLIKTINSPFYGLRSRVHSVMQAIHIMGLSRLSLMVTAMVLRDVLKGMNKFDMTRFWDSSTKIATISAYIASRLPYISYEHMRREIDRDMAYTYGLFQDCGIPLLLNHYPSYKEVLAKANQECDAKFTDIENAAFEQNHAAVGFYLARSWGLPEAMYQSIHHHHDHDSFAADDNYLSTASRDLVALALLAERTIQLNTGFSQTCEWEKGGAWVMRHFGLSDAEFEKIVQGVRTLYEEGNLNI